MSRIQKNHFLIGVLAVIFGFICKIVYRPYAYEQQIQDLGFADGAPSLFYVIGFSQLLLVKKFKYPWLVILTITLGSLAYEIMQQRNGSLDLTDIGMSILGGVSSFILWKVLKK